MRESIDEARKEGAWCYGVKGCKARAPSVPHFFYLGRSRKMLRTALGRITEIELKMGDFAEQSRGLKVRDGPTSTAEI